VSGYDPEALFRALHKAGIRYVLIGGWAVNAHGHHRYTGDVDICPDPEHANLERLAALLRGLNASALGLEEFSPAELPADPRDPDGLAGGGNFRTLTDLGVLDLMQWVNGGDRELEYADLAADALSAEVLGLSISVCSLPALLEMKRAAGRPRDLEDLEHLEADG